MVALSRRTITAERGLGVPERGFCLGIALRIELLLKDAWLLHLIGNKAPSVARDISSEVARTLNRRCYPHTGNGGHGKCLSGSLTLSVGLSIQREAVNVVRSAPQGDLYRADVMYLIKKGAWGLWYSGLCLLQLGSRPTLFRPCRAGTIFSNCLSVPAWMPYQGAPLPLNSVV